MTNEPIYIKMMAEIGEDFLWSPGGHDGRNLDIPEELRQRLLAWEDIYDAYSTDKVTLTDDERLAFRVQGLQLAAELQQALGIKYIVSYQQAM